MKNTFPEFCKIIMSDVRVVQSLHAQVISLWKFNAYISELWLQNDVRKLIGNNMIYISNIWQNKKKQIRNENVCRFNNSLHKLKFI